VAFVQCPEYAHSHTSIRLQFTTQHSNATSVSEGGRQTNKWHFDSICETTK